MKPIKKIDVVIIGAGVAGLTAGIYAAMQKLDTLILEDQLVGGQILDANVVENYPGFTSTSGSSLAERMHEQAISLGANIDEFDSIVSVKLTDAEKIVETDRFIYHPKAVIIAAGMKRRPLPIKEETKYRSRGIHYCELCDGHMYEGKEIAVIGGGRGGVGAALSLSKYATKITLIHHGDKLAADPRTIEKLQADSKIHVMLNSEVVSAAGDGHLESLTIADLNTQKHHELKVQGAFVFVGWLARTDIYKDYIKLDAGGNIIAGEDCKTNVLGVFAAGDVRQKLVRQLTTAVSDGTIAAVMAEEYIRG